MAAIGEVLCDFHGGSDDSLTPGERFITPWEGIGIVLCFCWRSLENQGFFLLGLIRLM